MIETQVQGLSAQDLRRRMRPQAQPSPVSLPPRSIDGIARRPMRPAPHVPLAKRSVGPRKLAATPMIDIAPKPRGISATPVQPQASAVLKRQAFVSASTVLAQQADAPAPASKPKKHRSKAQAGTVAMAIMVFGVGLAASISTLQTNHSAKAQVAAIAVHAENSTTDVAGASDGTTPPSEVKPTAKAVSSYAVAPNLPRYIDITKLHVHARIRPMGVTRSGEMQAPASIYDAGWYNASAHPGDSGSNGAMLIDGHVLGATYPAVFSKIKNLVAGDIVSITRGDGQVIKYQVVKVQNYDANTLDVGMLLTSIQPGKAALNLITCGGKYLAKQESFDQRTVVFTVQI